MKQLFLYIALIVAFTSCEKDPIISSESVSPSTLEAFLTTVDTATLSDSVYAFVGNHPRFEKQTPEHPVHLFIVLPDNAKDWQLFVTDSLKFRDSLGAYKPRSYSEFNRIDERFVRVVPKLISRDHYMRVYYRVDGISYLSKPITNRHRSFQTRTIPSASIAVQQRANGYLAFQWQSLPATDHYLLELASPTGEVFMSLGVNRIEFQFYDLRNIRFNLTPELYDPKLVAGNTYTLSVKAISNRNYLLGVGELEFQAP